MMRERLTENDGYVLVAALVFIALIASLAASTLSHTAGASAQVRTALNQTRSAALLDAGLASAAYALFAGDATVRPPSAIDLPLDGGLVRVAIEDEAGRVDLNAADEELLAALYRAFGGGRLQAESFAQAVVSWRDMVREKSSAGEVRPFRHVGDLLQVPGAVPADVNVLLQHATVFNPKGSVSPLSAPLRLIAALPGTNQADLERLTVARQVPGMTTEAVSALLVDPSRHLARNPSGIYRVRIAARVEGGYPREAWAVLAASDRYAAGFGVLAWYGEGAGR